MAKPLLTGVALYAIVGACFMMTSCATYESTTTPAERLEKIDKIHDRIIQINRRA